ncbi:MAG TPA: SCO family protein [Mycobacteriales bacterium]|nr:SCO family protein [Mycobacteriales bacterium]
MSVARAPARRAALRRLAAVTVTALALTACAGTSTDAEPTAAGSEGWHGIEPEPVPERPRFVLRDTSGREFDFAAETGGEPTYVYFGYTDCPDECPTAMADIAAALRQADPDLRDDVNVVFVTTDPERDTPERLRDWLARFDERIVGLVGTQAEVDAAQRAAGIRPAARGGEIPTLPGKPNEHAHASGTAPHSHDRPLGYAVEHANVIFAYDVDDRLPVLYPAGSTAGDLAADLPKLATPAEDRS